ncbi:conserved hypothetical protein [Brucella ceti M644/93/1]|uniref:Uncharacterized protein n=1 Tax=Brucella ceti M644/93/1 TaxID=520459 RepID=A0ABM9ZBR6_9HYPH|nr:conserved hypothetical protein [Brucella ceti M13/05/1]EEX97171.1 conserved hypothetical protein [Brucella ceti M644/93/1]PZV41702.1 sulfate transporter family protein [Brucella abortus]
MESPEPPAYAAIPNGFLENAGRYSSAARGPVGRDKAGFLLFCLAVDGATAARHAPMGRLARHCGSHRGGAWAGAGSCPDDCAGHGPHRRFFLDDVAEIVEREDYPADPPGTPLPLGRSVIASLKFLGVVILGNGVALILLFVPGINLIAFFVINAYLLSREFFEFAAMRYRSEAEAKALRSQYGVTVFLAGLVIAGFMAIPIVNLLTPLFAATMMVHLHKAISKRAIKTYS